MTTAFHYDAQYATHTLDGHPEHGGRLTAIHQRLQSLGVFEHDAIQMIDNRVSTKEELLRVHTRDHLDLLQRTAELDSPAMLGADTYVVPQSYHLARLAVGGVLNCVNAVLSGQVDNALACVRPPGHHATPSTAMGFCLLSNVALAAQHAVTYHGLNRVAIVDFDVHHGNGTQDALYDNGAVLFISSHQSPLYPGTGAVHETGRGAGRGLTVNIPVPPHTGDAGLERLYTEVVMPVLARFQPELLLISAGFDAHWRDPLANLRVSLTGFAALIRLLQQAAASLCNGRIIAVTEGGYDLAVLGYGVSNLLQLLLGQGNMVEDPLGKKTDDQSVAGLVTRLKSMHDLA
jgi:acetoin utilization deacetylase AcuC-like enzyme